jgi:hypothetical protein
MAGTAAKLGGIVVSVLDAREVGGAMCALAGDGPLSVEACETNNQSVGFSATAGTAMAA